MTFTPNQVIELWRAMTDWEELGVDGNGETVQRPVSPHVRRLLDSMAVRYVDGWQAHGELRTESRNVMAAIKQFFKDCADALPVDLGHGGCTSYHPCLRRDCAICKRRYFEHQGCKKCQGRGVVLDDWVSAACLDPDKA